MSYKVNARRATIEDLRKELWLKERDNGDIVWVNKDGDKIAIKEMSEEYLKNVIRYLERAEEFEYGPSIWHRGNDNVSTPSWYEDCSAAPDDWIWKAD